MKPKLRRIYDALSAGELSQAAALEQIRTVKLQDKGMTTGVLLATPVWRASEMTPGAAMRGEKYAAHHVIVCDAPPIDVARLQALVPHARCAVVSADAGQSLAERYHACARGCFQQVADILRSRPAGSVLAQVVVIDEPERTVLAGLSALLKTAGLEQPHIVGQLLLVPADTPTERLGEWLAAEARDATEPLVRYGHGGRQIVRWTEITTVDEAPHQAFDEAGVYLITGGLGDLGRVFAGEILTRASGSRVVLTGRSDLTPDRHARLKELSVDAGRVSYRQLELGDLDQVRRVIDTIHAEHGRLDGILHCAGMTADGWIRAKSAADFDAVLAPKVAGTLNLDRASEAVDLSFFVLFSSVAAVLGNPGQADYATANAFLDWFAAYRNRLVATGARRGRTRSIEWGLWQAGGLRIDAATQAWLQRTTGTAPMQTASGLDAFYRSLALPHDQVLALEGDVAMMRRVLRASRPTLRTRSPETTPEPAVTPHTPVAAFDTRTLVERAQDYLGRQCSELLKLPSFQIDPQASLETYGIDSIVAMRLTSHLEQTFGSLPKTLFFEHQTLRELAEYFARAHSTRLATVFASSGEATRRPGIVRTPSPSRATPLTRRRVNEGRIPTSDSRSTADRIAVIGMSGRYPEAIDLDAFWHNLREGKDCIVEVPEQRWDWREYFSDDRSRSGHHYSKWGGFIAGVDEFDPLFFNIAPKDAPNIDPQERLFLQHAWAALEDAGYTRASLRGSDAQDQPAEVGVYVGVMYMEYQLFGVEASARGKRLGVAGSAASIANRVSYALNLHGPSIALDTMCSSSLTAVHLACQDLREGRASLAIAGGVNVSIHPNKYLVLSAGQFISSDGHCQSFGEGGDGYIPGEGVGVVILKRLSEAERDGDHVYGVIRGSAINHGGRTNGYTVPNPNAQASAVARALAESGTDARHVSYIEAHGTGTKLGDPIEIAALSKAFRRYTEDSRFCWIGSAKSNIGHCESAAGIAGLTKVLLQMQHQEIAPSLHSTQLNPHIDFETTPFLVCQSLQPWERPVIDGRTMPRIAGVSSFGAGGSNAHLIVEEYPAPAPESIAEPPFVILLSARTPDRLQQKARDLLAFVRARAETIDLAAMAYTLQVGREPMDERLGFIVSSIEQLVEKLQRHVSDEEGLDSVCRGRARRHGDTFAGVGADGDLHQAVDRWIANRKLPRLLELWVEGLDLDWNRLYDGTRPRRIALPAYPFARERCWVDVRSEAPVSASSAAGAVLHPLLHRNTSDLTEQRYESAFTGDELFLTDVAGVNGEASWKVLPDVACLEMARAAVEHAVPVRPAGTIVDLRESVWGEPIGVSAPIGIAVVPGSDDTLEYEIYSQAGDQEIVHCQGRAVWCQRPMRVPLDLDRLRADGEIVAHVQLPAGAVAADAFVLHPVVLAASLRAASTLMKDRGASHRRLASLDSLRVVSPCRREMAAWVRHVPGDASAEQPVTLDIDLCDPQGHLCVELRGIRWQASASRDIAAAMPLVPMPAPQTSLPASSARREIVLDTPGEAVSAPEKPARITLASPPALAVDSIFDAPSLSSAARTPITLSLTDAEPPGHAPAAPMHAPVRLHDDGQGVWSIEIALPLDEPPTVDTAAALRRALERAQQEPDVRVLVLRGLEHAFVRGSRAACDSALSQGVNRALASFPAPVIAVLRRDAIGAAFLAASLCDIVVCNEEASYGFTHPDTQLYPSLAEARLFGARYGRLCMQDLLFVELAMTGAQLRAKGWSCSILPPAQIEPHVQQLTADLAAKVPAPLRLLKQDLLRDVAEALADITPVALHGPVDEGTGVVRVLTIEDGLVSDLLRDVRAVLAGPRQPGPTSTLLLVIDAHEPRGESPSGAEEDALLELCRLVLATESPVVVALPRGARSQFWLLGQCCDACVYSRDDVYSWADLGSRSHLWAMAADVVAHRLGSAVSKEIMLTGADYTGRDLEYRLGAIVAAARGDVVPTARRVAETWTRLPADTLAAWKRHTATVLQGIHRRPLDLAESTGNDASEPLPSAPTRVPLSSSVVTVTAHPDGIVVVQMEERAAKNALTDPLLDGLVEAFAHIAQTPAYKVVVLTGYDSYFSSGGTRDTLLAIHAGQARFTDRKTFQVALDCPLPVIAAVQGHAVGAGWSMALFADVVVLSEESRYASPYLDYGFTPAAGATYILAKMLGSDLARESLLTARPYVGREFRARGVRLQVRPPEAVYPASMAVARQMTQRSRRALIGLKQCWTTGEHAVLDDTYRRELAMHAQTFVGQAAARAQIDRHVAGIPESSPAGGRPTAARGDEQWTAAAVADEAAMTRRLKALLAVELQMREDEIDDQAPFVDLGLDSISGVAWIRKINDTYRTAIEATRVYSYPTLAQFSRYVTEEAERSGTLPAAAPPRSVDGRAARISASANLAAADVTPLKSRRRRAGLRVRSDAPAASRRPTIAVIGMAGQFPQARTLDAFWQNLAEGRNCISEVSPDRWDVRAYYQPGAAVAGKTNSRWMGALEDYDRFDPLFFNISPSEAESMDPQQRLFLQACWHAIEDACYDARGLSASKCGVFVGCTTGDYHQRWRVHELNAHRFTGSASSILAARIAYFLNLQGACLAIDTACSSSLVAVAQACDSLSARDSDLALAGGVYVMAGPEMHIRTAQAGMLSAEGRCFTFDRRADGFVPGEAVGVVMLKRLDDAVKDRDLIYGVIEGWGVNQDGRTNGITAPNPESQVRLEQDVYDKYGIDPASIQLVEAHGTATKLGDPIEVEGLKTAFRKYTDKREYCALGSVKSNIGHCLTAAGIAGVIKVLLALRHERIPPTINFEEMNDRVDLSDSPFYVNTRLRPWELNGATRRRGAISSFGFSGTNAHLVIGDYRPGVEPVAGTRSAGTPAIVLLSAATAAQLRQKAQDLLDLLEQGPVALDDLAYTLQVGRQPMDERFGVVVHAVDELVARLRAYVRGDMQIAAAAQGRVTRTPVGIGALTQDPEVTDTLIASCIAKQKLSALVQLWVTGVDVDWRRLYGASTPRRMRLPLYPFARERYWIDAPVSTHETSSHLLAPAPAAGTLLAIPTWRRSDLAPGITASEAAYVEQHVVVCGMAANDAPALQAAMPHVRVLMLTADTNQTLADRYAAYGRTCFEHIAGIVRNQPAGRVLVQVVVADEPAHAVLAGLSSLLKSAALERPYLAAQLLLVAADTRSETLAGYLAGEARGGMEPLIRYGRDGRHVMRWEEIMAGEAPSVRPFEAGGVYLITGGLGALGRLFAGEILRQAQRSHVILTGRSALTAERRARLRAVTTEADRVSYRQVDLGDLDQVRRLIAAVGEEHGRLDGILHSAGMVADALIENKAGDDFDAVLAPKVSGTFNLDRASESVDLAFFVLFSSVAAVLGNPGQADYATANGFLDWFASYRNRLVAAGERRGRTRSINWPLWEVGGLRMDSAIQALLHQTTGIQPMQTAVGLQTFYRSLALSGDRMLVLAGDLPRIRTYLHAACLFDRPSSPRTPTPDSVTGRDAAARISIDQLVQRLKAIVGATLRIEERLVEVDRPFVELGVDSFIGAELVLAINGAFGTALSHTALFNHPTIAELSRILQHEIETLPDGAFGRPGARLDVTSAPPAGAPAVLTTRIDGRVPAASDDRKSDEQIAIVGMSGRYPQAESLDQYWSNLVEGRNSIVEVPASRWDVNRYYDPDRSRKGKTNSKWLGALDDVDCFDPLFFRISPHEAAYMDPQHRLFLQESYKAFEHAGYSGAALRNTKCGVYLGISTNEYMALVSRTGAESSPVTSHSNAIAAARIAYYLNLKGPAIAIDTACSSSLVAIHLGSQALVSGEIDMALAGGVTLWLVSDSYVSMSQAGMFSPSGQCKAFDDTADGIVNGDGVGVVVLKRLRDARRDNDVIYGVILGSGINQDGRTNGITAPSISSQIDLQRDVYTKHGIDPDTIGYVETHGTGTRLGDPIELEALSTVFRERTARRRYCGLGSVKSNIGHTTAAAGVAGLHKVLLSMQHRTLVPTLNVTRETTRFDFESSPFYLVRETKPWEVDPGARRRAAVNSFGFSGTNAHLVVEEYQPPAGRTTLVPRTGPFIVPLSARTPEQLQQRARDLLTYVSACSPDSKRDHSTACSHPLDLADLAYTFQVGREAMEERLALVVSSVPELSARVKAFVDCEQTIVGAYRGRVEPGEQAGSLGRHNGHPAAAGSHTQDDLAALAASWVVGAEIDWNRLYGDSLPRRIGLPTYPFAKERYWLEERATDRAANGRFDLDGDPEWIDDIVDRICDDAISAGDAVAMLRAGVQRLSTDVECN